MLARPFPFMSTTPRPKLKICCVCRGGNTRSVAMKMILSRYLGHDAIACGVETNSPQTLEYIAKWADAVVIMEASLVARFPSPEHTPIYLFCVREDIWGTPFDSTLQAKIVRMLNERPVFNFGRVIDFNRVQKNLDRYREKLTKRVLAVGSEDQPEWKL